MISDKEILAELTERFPKGIKPVEPFPKHYPEKVKAEKVKAIYLGCDPTNKHTDKLPYVFALEDTPQELKAFVTMHSNQIKALGLTWNDVFVQNLCRNYFMDETNGVITFWKKVAKEYWIGKLKEELDDLKIPNTVPILLSSIYLYEVLVDDAKWKKKIAPDFYNCKEDIPIPADKNKLGRPLIPLYRGKSPKAFNVSYYLKNTEQWQPYINRVKAVLKT